MITALPTHHAVNLTALPVARSAPPAVADGSWRYDSRRPSRPIVIISVLVSIGIHVAILFGIGKPTARKAVAPPEENLIALVPLPQLKDLEEPEPAPTDDTGPAPDLSLPVPMQADVPTQWHRIKAAVGEVLMAHGATTTHHHAVGRVHRPWYDQERPAPFAAALQAVRRVVDPTGMMNPGVLVD